MFNLDDIRKNVKKAGKEPDRNVIAANRLISEAIELIGEFSESLEKEKLLAALDRLQESLRLNRLAAKPYALLSFIFLGLEDFAQAKAYYQTARKIDPELPLLAQLSEQFLEKDIL